MAAVLAFTASAFALPTLPVLPVLSNSSAFHAPVTRLVPDLVTSLRGDDHPVVFMHGMGDAGSNPGMQSLAKTVTDAYPNKYSVAVDVADGISSILESMDAQLTEFVRAVRRDPQLRGGFDAVGLSQGNLIIRAYVERYNDPPVRRFVSICGPMEGEGTCPTNVVYELVCPIWKLDKYGANIAFSGYWKDANGKDDYLKRNVFLPDVNNERPEKNATYRKHMTSLEAYVLVEASLDTMLVPRQTAHHGFWGWGDEWGQVVPMEESEGYKGDWIGLRTLDEAGRIKKLSFKGDHLRFTDEWWTANVLPVFA